jgi:hypothetical protein
VPFSGAPLYLALVDTCCDEDFLELAKSGLMAALEALPQGALFGLVTFGSSICLWDVQGRVPVVRRVPLLEDLQVYTPLADVLPLAALVAPVGRCKEQLASVIDGLVPDQGADRCAFEALGFLEY